MEGVNSHSKVEGILSSSFGDVLVSGNTSCFKSFRGNLFNFERDEVNTKREFVNRGFLLSQIVNSQFGIRDTTAVSRFNVGLAFADSIAKNVRIVF